MTDVGQPPAAAGWYLLEAEGGASADEAALLVGFAGSPTPRRLALSADTDGTIRQLLLLEREVASWSLAAAPQSAAVSLRRVGRLRAAVFMLSHMGGSRRTLTTLRGMAGALLRGRMRQAGALLLATYESRRHPGEAPLRFGLRRHWWLPTQQQNVGTLDQLQRVRTAQGRVAWEATDIDPKIRLWENSADMLPKGWYRLRGRFETLEGRLSVPCLYMDYGAGFSAEEATHFPQPGADGRLDALVLLKFPAAGLRFDPTTRPATFALSDLALERASRVGALLRMLLAFRSPNGRLDGRTSLLAARRFGANSLTGGISAAAHELHQHYLMHRRSDPRDYTSWVREHDTLNERDLRAMGEQALAYADGPLISILLPVYAPPERWLRRCIDSVRRQAYPKWELCIAEDASPSPRTRAVLAEYQRLDPRIKVVFRPSNGHISAASNTALEMATGDYVGLLDHDDELRPHSLLEVVRALDARPQLGLVYSDEDKIDQDGRRFDPYFKPDWNPELLRGQNYVCHFTVLRTALVREVGGFREGFEGSQDHDLFLRCTERLEPAQIHHIPHILYHWRAIPGSTATGHDAKDYAAVAGVRAVAEHLLRTGIGGEALQLPHGHCRVRLEIAGTPPLISIIIPTRDRVDLLRTCIDSILARSRYQAFEILVVDNRSADPEALAYLEQLQTHERVHVLRYDQPFNYSAINNFAVEHCRGELVCLLNNDIEVISPDWLQELAALAMQPEVGAVGAMLYYPDDTIQHAGVILGIGGVANHPYCGKPRGYPGHGGRVLVAQHLSAVTGACLMVRTSLYRQVGGLDEALQVAFNDIDFCLKLQASGYRNTWTPFAELYHHESASRGRDDTPEKIARFHREVECMLVRWQPAIDGDPAYNPNLSLSSLDFELAFPPRRVEGR